MTDSWLLSLTTVTTKPLIIKETAQLRHLSLTATLLLLTIKLGLGVSKSEKD